MNIIKLPLSALRKPERNMRMHPEAQIREYCRSIEKNGQLKPLVIDENNVIWIGNGLYEALTRCGYTEAYCLVKAGMTEAEKKKMMMADNKIFDLGVDDISTFDAFIAELKDDLDIPGYDEEILQSMVSDVEEVTAAMQEYGTLDTQEVQQIQAAREKKEQAMAAPPPAAPAPAPQVAPPPQVQVNVTPAPAPERPSVVCPHCGETIWL